MNEESTRPRRGQVITVKDPKGREMTGVVLEVYPDLLKVKFPDGFIRVFGKLPKN